MFRSKSKAHVLEQEKVALERERIALYREKILLERVRLERTTPGRFGEYHGNNNALSPVKQPPPTYLKPVAGLPPPAPSSSVNKVAPRPAPPAPERKTVVPTVAVEQEKPSFRLRARSNSNSSSFQANSASFKRLPAVNSSFRSTASNRRSVDENLCNNSLVESQKRLHLSTATYEEADSWAEEKQDRSFCNNNRSSNTTIDVKRDVDENVYTAEAVDTSVEENESVPIAPFEEEEEMKTVTIILQVPKSCNVTVRETM